MTLFRTEKTALMAALTSVKDIARAKAVVPILQNLLFQASGDTVTVTATNQDLRASVYALRSVLALTATADAQNPLSSKKHEPCNSADLDCDPADVHSAQDKGYRIGTIYDGHSGSCAEPCAADIYERPDEEPLPQPRRKDGGEPCGECYIQTGETCDICGAVNPSPAPREELS